MNTNTSEYDMQNKTILITGATAGVGRITAEKMAGFGAKVLLHGRSSEKIAIAIEEIKAATGNDNIIGYRANLEVLQEVKELADRVIEEQGSLDILINNAGVGPGIPEDQTKLILCSDKHELRFQVNYLATALLCQRLLPALKKRQGRIINISSEAQSSLNFDNLMQATGFEAYAQSKLAVIIFTLYFAEKIKDTGVTVNALDPGSFLNTRMVRDTYGSSPRDPETGANAHINLACSKELNTVTGEYFTELQRTRAHQDAYSKTIQQRLYDITKEILLDV